MDMLTDWVHKWPTEQSTKYAHQLSTLRAHNQVAKEIAQEKQTTDRESRITAQEKPHKSQRARIPKRGMGLFNCLSPLGRVER
jgi:hypothetical protein